MHCIAKVKLQRKVVQIPSIQATSLFVPRMSKIEHTIHCFEYLSQTPYVPLCDINPTDRICGICFDPYSTSPIGYGDFDNRPLRLPCGHMFGLQCLAHWMFSPNFDHHCSLCRTKIVPSLRQQTQQALPKPLTHTAAHFQRISEVNPLTKQWLDNNSALDGDIRAAILRDEVEYGRKYDMDRVWMLFDVQMDLLEFEAVALTPPVLRGLKAVALLLLMLGVTVSVLWSRMIFLCSCWKFLYHGLRIPLQLCHLDYPWSGSTSFLARILTAGLSAAEVDIWWETTANGVFALVWCGLYALGTPYLNCLQAWIFDQMPPE